MVSITITTIQKENEWEEFLRRKSEASFLQSWYWGEFHKALRHTIYRVGFYKNNVLVGIMLSTIEDAKRGRYLTVPGGPLIDWNDTELISSFVETIQKQAREKKCVFIRVRPQLEENEQSISIFSRYGFIQAPTHLHAELTSRLDITKSEDELLIGMRKNTRYEIKKAREIGIKITTSNDPTDIKEFYTLQLETAKRQSFVPFSYPFLYEQFKIFSQKNYALLYKAKYGGQLLTAAFIIFYGKEAVYHYGASTTQGRKYPGAYLIQWEAIREAKKRSIPTYNFWGVSPLKDEHHRFSGLSLFKRGFGGSDYQYLPSRDLVINKPLYNLNRIIETVRQKVRRL